MFRRGRRPPTGLVPTFLILGVLVLETAPAGATSMAALPPPVIGTTPSQPSATATAQAAWPMYLQNPQHTASAPYATNGLNSGNAKRMKELWSYNTGAVISASPVVAHGLVYIGAWNGYEYALNATTGAFVWKTFLGENDQPQCGITQGVVATPEVVNNTIYVAGGGDYWYSLNATTGKILLNVTLDNTSEGAENWASTLIVGDEAYQGLSSFCDLPLIPGGIAAINLTTGATMARFNTTLNNTLGDSIWSTPVFDPQTNSVFAATGNAYSNGTYASKLHQNAVLRLNATTLAFEGQFQVPKSEIISDGDFGASPTLVTFKNGTQFVLIANKNGFVYALNAADPTSAVWMTRITPIRSLASGAYGGGLYYVGGPKATWKGVTSSGALWALYPSNGTVAWEHKAWGDVYGPPAYANGLVAYGGGNGFFILNASTGSDLKTFKLGSRPYGGPAYAYGTFFEPTTGGTVFAFGIPGISGDPPHSSAPSDPNSVTSEASVISIGAAPLVTLPRWA